MPASKPIVFAVDDEQSNLDLIGRALRRFDVRMFADPTAVLDSDVTPDALVVDYRMPKLDGVSLITKLRNKGISCGALMVTAFPDLDEVAYALQSSLLYRIVPKPLDPQNLYYYVELILAEGTFDAELSKHDGAFPIEVLAQKSFSTRVGRIPTMGQIRLRLSTGPVTAELRNVSLGGFGMAGELNLAVGTSLQVESVTLAGKTFVIDADCTVMWSKHDTGTASLVGVEFSRGKISWATVEPVMRQAYVCYLADSQE